MKRTRAKTTGIPLERLRQAAAECDGHSILRPDLFTKLGLPPSFVAKVTRVHTSDGTPKGTIFNERGEALLHLHGVYALDMLWQIADHIEADTSKCGAMGRGFLARQLQTAISARLDEMEANG